MASRRILSITASPSALALTHETEGLTWEQADIGGLAGRHAELIIAVVDDDEPRSGAFLRRIAAEPWSCPVLAIVPADASVDLLRSATHADDFVMLPPHAEELRWRIDRLLGSRGDDAATAKVRLAEEACLRSFVTGDPRTLRVLEDVRLMARMNAPVLIIGETGTGKELCARALHHLSSRRNGPFVPVDCPALPDHLLENELFGHVRGAYTDAHQEQKGLVALARGGSLFLDEVDSLSAVSQAKLLRFLQDGQYRPLGSDRFVASDVTLIAASNRDLREYVEDRRFRGDLYYRLNVLNVVIPPLRERPGDIELLAEHYLREIAGDARAAVLTASALELLRSYHWPGNVRELINTLTRAAVLARNGRILPAQISFGPQPRQEGAPQSASYREARARALEAFERKYVVDLLQRHHGNVTHAAREAGKERRAFGRILRKYDIHRTRL